MYVKKSWMEIVLKYIWKRAREGAALSSVQKLIKSLLLSALPHLLGRHPPPDMKFWRQDLKANCENVLFPRIGREHLLEVKS